MDTVRVQDAESPSTPPGMDKVYLSPAIQPNTCIREVLCIRTRRRSHHCCSLLSRLCGRGFWFGRGA
eukprot:7011176-Prorocentrum_lima.AAC.1